MRQGFHDRLVKEIDTWKAEGVITPEQADVLSKRYHAESEIDKKAGPGRFTSTVAILGSTLLGIGVILFFAANWQVMPRYQKLVLVILFLTSVNYAGYVLAFTRRSFPRVGYSLLFLGMLLFGSSIFLVAQAYHIDAHFPNGFLLWAAGVLPAAYLLGSRMGIVLFVLIIGVWIGLESYYYEYAVYRLEFTRYVIMYLAYGLFLFVIGRSHKTGKRKGFAAVYSSFGIALAMAATYLLTFKRTGLFFAAEQQHFPDRPLLFYIFFAVASILLGVYGVVRRDPVEKLPVYVMAGLLVLFAATALQLVFLANIGSYPLMPEDQALFPILYNILLLSEIVGVLAIGYRERVSAFINTSLVFFVLLVATRYFDFLWELLPRSVFFMFGGLLLIAGGLLLERKRRRIMAAIRVEATGT